LLSGGGIASAQSTASPKVEKVTVTGSRIPRKNAVSNSPVTTSTQEEIVGNADVTLDKFLNTLPSVNASFTSTSNNPGNFGIANIDLRGLGTVRTVTLIDGRRTMPVDNTLTVDLNTIPAALIERIEIATGGQSAVYGADAVAGVVNIILKRNFEGVDARASYSNSVEFWDAKESTFSGVIGGNFAEGRGNAVIALERTTREGMIKSQRDFAKFATSTTNSLPEGVWAFNTTGALANAPSQAALDALFGTAGYGGLAPGVVPVQSTTLGFNLDGSIFYRGVFNSPLDVRNFRYPIDDSVNQRLFPDFYSYNFDAVNLLTLPLNRTSFMAKGHYEIAGGVEAYGQLGWAKYDASTALAPTPVTGRPVRNPADVNATNIVSSTLVEDAAGATVSGANAITALLVPVTNPFIPGDLAGLLASRTGDDTRLVGVGAAEPFRLAWRTLPVGLRLNTNEREVVQYLFGLKGPVGSTSWTWDVSLYEGFSDSKSTQSGNINSQRMQQLLEAPDGGDSLCAGGFNPFGRNPLSPECIDFLEVSGDQFQHFDMNIAQATANGDLFDLPAGTVQAVVGAEIRQFNYDFDAGPALGPVSGFNVQNAEGGKNEFQDVFAEALLPLVADAPLAQALELTLGYRYSSFSVEDKITGTTRPAEGSSAYKAELSWSLDDSLRFRGSYQHSVRAPTFVELFAGGGGFPEVVDPCSVTSKKRTGPDAAAVAALCAAQGGAAGSPNYVQPPGEQWLLSALANPDLKPEEADTFTVGLVFSSPDKEGLFSRVRGSIDYYSIDIQGPIATPGVNTSVANCFNYYGNNPTYSNAFPACAALTRGGLTTFGNPLTGDAASNFTLLNGGVQETAGVDMQLVWSVDLEDLDAPANWGTVDVGILASHLLYYRQQDVPGYPTLDYAGSSAFFGEGVSQAFPDWKATITTKYSVDDYAIDVRARYISAMENRASVIFPGETFTGPESVWYFDVAGSWNILENLELRAGLNNAFDREPPLYRPNQQSGTDPSTYDIVGRRFFGQVNVRF
jgi:outer membrane receptor protein involved in Fe transport